MPTKYIQNLAKRGVGSEEELEKQWERAKKKAKKHNKGRNYAYINSIFKKLIGEMMDKGWKNLVDEIPNHEFEQLISNDSPEEYENHLKTIDRGKYRMTCDDNVSKLWQKGDTVNIDEPICPKKNLGGLDAYEITVNNCKVLVLKDFLEKIEEEDGGGDGGDGGDGGVSTTTADVAGYNAPFQMKKTSRRKKPDQILWGGELGEKEKPCDDPKVDEDGTDFSLALSHRDSIPSVSDSLYKKFDFHTKDLVKQKDKAMKK